MAKKKVSKKKAGKKHGKLKLSDEQITVKKKKKPDYAAPDKSQIFLLTKADQGDMAMAVLPPGHVSTPVQHQTVEEMWFVVSGKGSVYRSTVNGGEPVRVTSGTSLTIPTKSVFQFKNSSRTEELQIVMSTMPPWPGPTEAWKTHKGYDETGEPKGRPLKGRWKTKNG